MIWIYNVHCISMQSPVYGEKLVSEYMYDMAPMFSDVAWF